MKKSEPESVKKKKDASEVLDPAKRLRSWFGELPPETVDQLILFHSELLKFNKTINLISSTTVRTADSVHVADCVLASKLIFPALVKGQPLYDFGSGNGCPGVLFAALYPTQQVVLVDRDTRKMEFCKHAASTLGLKNVSVLLKGVEELPTGSVVNAVSRGFAPFARALLTTRRVIGKGGRFFHMKGDGWANEIAQMPSQVFTHWTPSLVGQYRLPETLTEMFVVMTEKIST